MINTASLSNTLNGTASFNHPAQEKVTPIPASGHQLDETIPTHKPPSIPAEIVEPNHLVSSPYTTPAHLLDLSSLTTAQSLLARALTIMSCTRTDYATASYTLSYNWADILARLGSLSTQQDFTYPAQKYYIVVFRSRIPATTSREHLGRLDELSHEEANKSGGLLKYWFGVPDENGRNLATCIWRDFRDSKPASAGPGHREAARRTRELYMEWKIERLALEIEEGVKSWKIGNWVD